MVEREGVSRVAGVFRAGEGGVFGGVKRGGGGGGGRGGGGEVESVLHFATTASITWSECGGGLQKLFCSCVGGSLW